MSTHQCSESSHDIVQETADTISS